MAWLETNLALLEEIRSGVPLKKGMQIAQTNKTVVSAFGSYQSEILGRDLHLALKTSRTGLDHTRLIFELGVAYAASQQLPELEPELPLVLGLLKDRSSNKTLGLLTEDFSEG